jgi:hypothetical protein
MMSRLFGGGELNNQQLLGHTVNDHSVMLRSVPCDETSQAGEGEILRFAQNDSNW